VRGWNTAGPAIRTANNNTYAAIHLDADIGRIAVCAEAIALGMAVSTGDRAIEAVVAVTPDGDGWAVLPPCGMCREMLSDYAPDAYVILPHGDDRLNVRRVLNLLPDTSQRAERYPPLDTPGKVGRKSGGQ
jgi:cytidine deaminase